MNRMRRETRGQISYAEAVKRVEEKVTEQAEMESEEEKAADKNLNVILDKRQFLAFIAMVINCAADIKTKSEIIKMVLDAAKRFLNVVDVTGEDLDNTLREGFASTQTSGSG